MPSFVNGSLPFGLFVSLPPLASGPLMTLPFGLPADETPAMQAQHLIALAQKMQGMALSLHLSMASTALEVPLLPVSVF